MKVLDLFCGCGGFSSGFEQAGFKVKYGIDNSKLVRETFEYNHPNTEFILSDVRDMIPEDFKNIEIIIGSPPCQEFSVTNNNPNINKGMELIKEFLRWIEIINPKFWIMENVPQTTNYLKKRIKDFNFHRILVLNSANYRVPQKRKRCFAGKYRIPIPTHSKIGQINLLGEELKQWRTVLDAIGNIMDIKPNQSLELGWFENSKKWRRRYKPLDLNKPTHTIRTKMSEHHYIEIPNHECFNNMKEINYESTNREIKLNKPSTVITSKDRCKKKLPILSDQRSPTTSKGNSPFYSLDRSARTITSFPHSIMKDKKKVYRRLTVRECARLQSFPDDFIFFGSLSSQYKMVGNAVPPLMAYNLAKAIRSIIEV